MGNGRRPYKRIAARASAAVSAVAMLVTLTVAGTALAATTDTSLTDANATGVASDASVTTSEGGEASDGASADGSGDVSESGSSDGSSDAGASDGAVSGGVSDGSGDVASDGEASGDDVASDADGAADGEQESDDAANAPATVADDTASLTGYPLVECSAGDSKNYSGDYSKYANCARPSVSTDNSIFDDYITDEDVSNPSGTTVNLFDYWLYDEDAADVVYSKGNNSKDWLLKTDDGDKTITNGYENIGINSGKQLKFRRWQNGWEPNFNRYTGDTDLGKERGTWPMQRMVKRVLDGNGFPKLWESSDSQSWQVPGLQDTAGTTQIAEEDELDYLFDVNNRDGKRTYRNVKGLFQLLDGYYTYDSEDNFASYDASTNNIRLYNAPAVGPANNTKSGMFFPFNTANQVFKSENGKAVTDDKGKLQMDKGVSALQAYMNHYFGLSMNSRFQQTKGGVATNGKDPVTFHFSGDDDAWVYIDGVLVGDLGGIHDAVDITIDFQTGEVLVDTQGKKTGTVQKTTLRELYKAAGKENATTWSDTTPDTFKDGSYHTLKFFYMERGNLDSNLSLKFNLVPVKESDILKIDQSGTPIGNVNFKLYKARKNDAGQYEYNKTTDLLAEGKTDENGRLMLERQVGDAVEPIVFDDLYANDTDPKHANSTYYVLEEDATPAGYRTLASAIQLEYHPATAPGFKGYIVSSDETAYTTGAFANASVLVTAPSSIYPLDAKNENKDTSWLQSQLGDAYSDGDISKALDDHGIMFAVILAYKGPTMSSQADVANLAKSENWQAVTGDSVKGWNVTAVNPENGSTTDDIIEAAKKQLMRFQVRSSGSYSVDIDELPGNAETYYNLLQEDEKYKTRYTVAYYYTCADDIDQATSANTRRLYMGVAGGTGGAQDDVFNRQFAINVHVPNIKNELVVRKVDEEGNPVYQEGKPETSATFSLYSAKDDCVKSAITYNAEENGDQVDYGALVQCTPSDTVQTDTLDVTPSGTAGGNTMTLASAAKFPSAGHTLENGTYWLVETKAPEHYDLNQDATKVIVNNTGVYADAGSPRDSVSVLLGVGSLVPTMSQFAAVDDLDRTLSDITAQVKTSFEEPGEDGSRNWSVGGSSRDEPLYLTYGARNDKGETVPYMYSPLRAEDDTTPITAMSVMREVTSGWSDMIVSQLYEGTVDVNGKEVYVSNNLKADQKDETRGVVGALTNLFTGSVVVQVKDTPKATETTAAVRKTIVNNAVTATWPERLNFTFDVKPTGKTTGPLPTGGAGTTEQPADTCVKKETAGADGETETGTIEHLDSATATLGGDAIGLTDRETTLADDTDDAADTASCTVTIGKPAQGVTNAQTIGNFHFDWNTVKNAITNATADENGVKQVTYSYQIRELGADGTAGSGGAKDLMRYSMAEYTLDVKVTYKAGDGLKATTTLTRVKNDAGTPVTEDVKQETDGTFKDVHVAHFTNTQGVAVSNLPLTGGMTARDWLLIGGGLLLAILLGGAAYKRWKDKHITLASL